MNMFEKRLGQFFQDGIDDHADRLSGLQAEKAVSIVDGAAWACYSMNQICVISLLMI